MNAGEMIAYTSVEEMAETYRKAVEAIRQAAELIGEHTEQLKTIFCDEHSYTFGIDLHYHSENYGCRDGDTYRPVSKLLEKVKLDCWAKVIEKLNIRRLMSSQRVSELNTALSGGEGSSQWPDITPENIERVANGYLMSATEFLEEAVAEEYDHWRPRKDSKYKTNAEFWKLTRKIMVTIYLTQKTPMVELGS